MARAKRPNKLDKFLSGNSAKTAVFALGFGVLGTMLLVLSHAATPAASVEAESGTTSSVASTIGDASAFSSHAVKFGPGPGSGGGGGTTTCNLNATTSNFAAQVSAAAAGQTVCLATGSYGNWTGTNKAITIAAAPGASPAMTFSFGSSDSGFTLDGMTSMGGDISSTANHITIRNSAFNSPVSVDGVVNSNIVFDHNTFNVPAVSSTDCTTTPADLIISDSTSPTGVTVSNTTFTGGNLDGVRLDASGGATILGNQFINITENSSSDCHHTDAIQMYGGENSIIQNNYFAGDSDGIVAFDGTQNNTITGNACGSLDRGACITLYSDKNSVVQHNATVTSMDVLEIDRKAADPAGSGTVFKDNAGSVSIANGSTVATNTNNLFSGASSPNINGTPIFVGGNAPTSWAGFKLTSNSPGIGKATDGTNVGIN